jgi:hypothetical protein
MLDHALAYASRGWAVFPLGDAGSATCKVPRTRTGHNGASKTPGVIRHWWADWPNANIGVRTGRESGLVVIDLDLQKPGVAPKVTQWLAAHGGTWGEPWVVRTGSGGLHLYYRYPPEHPRHLTIPKREALDGVVGLDIRADGGYAVAPPSRNLAGPYTSASSPDDMGDLSEALLAALTAERKERPEPIAREEWRPYHTITFEELGEYVREKRPMHEAIARVLRGESWAPHGKKHETMLKIIVSLQDAFGPIIDSGHLFARSCETARLSDPSTKASPAQWDEEFAKWWERGEAEHSRKAELLDLGERTAKAWLEINRTIEIIAQDAAVVTRETLKSLAKKAKDPNHAAILRAIVSGDTIDAELEPALEACGRWLGSRAAPDKVMPLAAQMSASTAGIQAFRTGLEAGHLAAQDKDAWRRRLIVGENERPLACAANAITILLMHPDTAGVLAFDTRKQELQILRVPPWPRGESSHLSESDCGNVGVWLTTITGVPFPTPLVFDALKAIRSRVPNFDPVAQYLDRCVWDGIPRLDSWLEVYAGAVDTSYVRAVARKTLLAAALRALRPGCKVDTITVLEGRQGALKSTLIKALCPDETWFSEHEGALSGRDKDTVQAIACGPWIVELGELAGLRRTEINAVKQFVSRGTDRFRPPYGRITESFPRKVVFIASTNDTEYLQDLTGNRRWWPVEVGQCNPAGLAEVRDLLWAEAVHALRSGEVVYLQGDVAVDAEVQQALRMETDVWDEELADFLSRASKPLSMRECLFAVGIQTSNANAGEVTRLRGVLTRAGFVQGAKERRGGLYSRFWRRKGWGPEGLPGFEDAAKAIASGASGA